MTRDISSTLKAAYALGTTKIAGCWRANLRDGSVIACTTYTEDLLIDGVTYLANNGFNGSDNQSAADLSVDNLEVDGFLASPLITEHDIKRGRWDYAQIEIFEVNFADLTMGKNIVRSGTLGRVTAGRSQFKTELRGLTQAYSRKIGRLVTQECNANLGDARCKIDLAPWTVTGYVAHVDDNKVITAPDRTEPTDWFTGGLLTFTSGLNNGLSMEVKAYTLSGGSGIFELFEGMPEEITAADTPGMPFPPPGSGSDPAPSVPDSFTVYAGCQKRFYEDCIGKFNNALNFRGFPHLPGVGVFGGPGTTMTPTPVIAHSPPPPPGSPPPPAPPPPSPSPGTPPPSPSSVSIGINIHDGGSFYGTTNAAIATILQARNMRAVRMLMDDTTNVTNLRDMIAKVNAYGGAVQLVLEPAGSWTLAPSSDLTATYNAAYANTTTLLNSVYDVVLDFEIMNEVQNRAIITNEVPRNSAQGTDLYTGQPGCETMAAYQKGMAQAIRDKATASGRALRVLNGLCTRDYAWIDFLDSKGVSWDVLSFHYYPDQTEATNDTWWYPTGALGMIERLGKPVTINEFNANEIYDSGYGNAAGDTLTEQGWAGNVLHGKYLIANQTLVESIVFYELVDQGGGGAEGRFGLLYNMTTPKVTLYIATAFAGGTLSSAERAELTSRGLFTDAEINAYAGVGSGGGTAGSSGSGYPFGSRRVAYASGVSTPSDTLASMDAFIKQQYDTWVANLYKTTPGGMGLLPAGAAWVQYSDPTFATVSEGMGYGMLITVLMSGYDGGAQQKFDALLSTVRAVRSKDYGGVINMSELMSWRVYANGTDAGAQWPALDGDMDIALALLMADVQWGSGGTWNYKSIAQAMLAQIKSYAFDVNGNIVETAGVMHEGRTSDYMFGHFRAFKRATGDSFWDNAIAQQKRITDYMQRNYAPATGLLPDWVGGVDTANPFLTTAVNDGGNPHEDGYWYNACRDPWRFGTDFAMTGDTDVKTYLTRMETFFSSTTGGAVTNIINGYALDGSGLVGANPFCIDAAFYCPMMVGAICDVRFQSWLDALWTHAKAHPESTYYSTEIQLLSAIVVSGNWWTP